jgi:DNA invertase Pin-like site-specific DNA recombinase
VVTRIDRLARSMQDLQTIVARLKEKGAHLAATEQSVDTSTATGKVFFDMLGVFAEFETNLRRERQAEGIKAAKRKGVYRGRPPKIDMATIQAKLGAGLSPTEIAREMGISRGTVYKAKAEMLTDNDIIEGPAAWKSPHASDSLLCPRWRRKHEPRCHHHAT